MHRPEQQNETTTLWLSDASCAPAPCWRRFSTPVATIRAERRAEIIPALQHVADAAAQGWYAAGFVTYEAAPAFDDACVTHPRGLLPYLWFGLFETVEAFDALPPSTGAYALSPWESVLCEEAYIRDVMRIKDDIARGDTYQVNYTQRLRAAFAGDPYAYFLSLYRAQRARYCAYIAAEDFAICSVSPELFFSLDGNEILCRPMKGTAPRGLTVDTDRRQRDRLQGSRKDRAENLMIVDMMRNDLGRIAQLGSVQVPELFTVEQYQTLWQMTSTVSARTEAGLVELFRALFPCASITGAPKIRTMEIIRELEPSPRGIYTGCIGFITPQRQAQFNVAIRTVALDLMRGRAEYGTGGGVVWDSQAASEYAECRTKALVLTATWPEFQLLETMRWTPQGGYDLMAYHLQRLERSASYFAFSLDLARLTAQLDAFAATLAERPHRVRLCVDRHGACTLTASVLDQAPAPQPWRIALACQPVDAGDRFLYHKTTHRQVYDAARAQYPEHDDVLLWNARGEITESTIANLVVKIEGRFVTPPVSCGLLAGTLRAALLERGEITEAVITRETLLTAEALYLINSVRGWVPIELDGATVPETIGDAPVALGLCK